MDPHALAGLATLIVLELVLGIDNLVFIAILANKLPAHLRDRARVTGLVLAMAMRLAMLSVASYVAALTRTVATVAGHAFSPRDILLVGGGIFLVYKATREIHEKLEGAHASSRDDGPTPTLGATLVQIVALDAIFSLDAIVTAVGMVEQLWIMMTAVIVSMAIMVVASRPLASFVARRPTVIMLCLCFLLLIGCSLVADGFGLHVPKTYLYAAIGFSLLIESFNQIGGSRQRRRILDKPMRERTADAIMRLMDPGRDADPSDDLAPPPPIEAGGLHDDESDMIRGVMSLASLTARSIMTLRPDVEWVDAASPGRDAVDALLRSGRTRVLVCDGGLDDVIGFVEAKDAFARAHSGLPVDLRSMVRKPLYVQESLGVIDLIAAMRRADQRFAVVIDETGAIEGVVTTTDIFAEIGGDLAGDEDRRIERDGTGFSIDPMTRLSDVERTLGVSLGNPDRDYETLSGHVLHVLREVPSEGASFEEAGWTFEVVKVEGRRVAAVAVRPTA